MGYIYKITNILTGKYYYGRKDDGNPDTDDILLNEAFGKIQFDIAHVGKDNFKTEIIFQSDDLAELLVTNDMLQQQSRIDRNYYGSLVPR